MNHTVAKNLAFEILLFITAAMIHWTRQIKEVLSAQDALETAESSGPLEEIDFWNNRCIDLSGLLNKMESERFKNLIFVVAGYYSG